MSDLPVGIEWLPIYKNFVIFLLSYFICFKILSNKKSVLINTISSLISAISLAILYHFCKFISNPYLIIIIMVISSCYFVLFTKNKIMTIITATIFSFGISYVIHLFSTFISTLIYMPIFGFNYNFYIIVPMASVIQIAIITVFFKLKKFNNILSTLNKTGVGSIGVAASGIILVIYALIPNENSDNVIGMLLLATGICVFGIISWLIETKKNHTKSLLYNHSKELYNETISKLKEELELLNAEKEALISEQESALTEKNSIIKISHKFTQRLSAVENVLNELALKAMQGKFSTEMAGEIAGIFEQTKNLSRQYREEKIKKIPAAVKLPKTNIALIDAMLDYQCKEANKYGINFFLSAAGDVKTMIEKHIEQGKLETLMGDHIKNAIIAINASDNDIKNIFVFIGISEGHYKFSVTDTGIPFEINTLAKLGKEQITTHADNGGSGIGFMTTFETMSECGASLIITEYPADEKTKIVSICFDNNNKYIIRSHRAEEIRKACEDDIIIEELTQNHF